MTHLNRVDDVAGEARGETHEYAPRTIQSAARRRISLGPSCTSSARKSMNGPMSWLADACVLVSRKHAITSFEGRWPLAALASTLLRDACSVSSTSSSRNISSSWLNARLKRNFEDGEKWAEHRAGASSISRPAAASASEIVSPPRHTHPREQPCAFPPGLQTDRLQSGQRPFRARSRFAKSFERYFRYCPG